MAPQHRPIFPLRIVTQRISAVRVEDLPHVASQLVDLIVASENYLDSQARSSIAKSVLDYDVVLHKFRTQISSLLQDKSSAARWTAVVLIKAFIGVGGSDVLQSCGPWVRSMVSFLGQKSEHPSVKKVSILALVKIFLATQDHPNLKREVTTPSLQPFITHCLHSACSRKGDEFVPRVGSPLLRPVLQAYITLLPKHPTAFRTFRQELRSLIAPLLAPTPSDTATGDSRWTIPVPAAITGLAQRLLALLPCCAPNNTAVEEWTRAVEVTLGHTNRTADCAFRSVKEEADSTRSSSYKDSQQPVTTKTLGDEIADILSLPAWHGVNAGIERLTGCFQILTAHIATSSAASLPIPISAIWKTTERVLSIMAPSKIYQPEANAVFEREEREALWARLNEVHEAVVVCIMTVLQRVGTASMSMTDLVMERLLIVFRSGHCTASLRCAIYLAITRVISLVGPSLSKAQISAQRHLVQKACADIDNGVHLLGLEKKGAADVKQMGSGALLGQHSQKSEFPPASNSGEYSDLTLQAIELLRTILAFVQPERIPLALRAMADRSLILAQNKEAMLASVLNPPRQANLARNISSILPFLARTYPQDLSVESLLRPRLPIIRSSMPVESDLDLEENDQSMADSSAEHEASDDNDQDRLVEGAKPTGTLDTEAITKSATEATFTWANPTIPEPMPVQSPKRTRQASPSQGSLTSVTQPYTAKKPRIEQAEASHPLEIAVEKQPVVLDDETNHRTPAGTIGNHSSELLPETNGDGESERSITPELIIPSDLGMTSEEDDSQDEDGAGDDEMET